MSLFSMPNSTPEDTIMAVLEQLVAITSVNVLNPRIAGHIAI